MPKAWMYLMHSDRCKRCGKCAAVCERRAITVPQGVSVTTSYGEVSIDQSKCDGCGKCLDVCKLRAISKKFRPHV